MTSQYHYTGWFIEILILIKIPKIWVVFSSPIHSKEPGILSFWSLHNLREIPQNYHTLSLFDLPGVPQMDGLWWKIILKVDDLGLPLFLETPTLTHLTNGAWNKKHELDFPY